MEERCPECDVLSAEGYMSHLTDCPQRAKERQIRAHMKANPPSEGLEAEDEGRGEIWAEYIWREVSWRWNQIDWQTVLLVSLAIAIACVLVWLGLEAIETR